MQLARTIQLLTGMHDSITGNACVELRSKKRKKLATGLFHAAEQTSKNTQASAKTALGPLV